MTKGAPPAGTAKLQIEMGSHRRGDKSIMAAREKIELKAWPDKTCDAAASSVVRSAVLSVSVFLMVFTPLFIAYELHLYMDDDSVYQTLLNYRADQINYPNVTLCHPKFFKNEYLREYNISNDLANYMLLALDSTTGRHVDLMASSSSSSTHTTASNFSHLDRLRNLEQELQAAMREHRLDSLLELYHRVAIKCEDFVVFCEEHRDAYTATAEGGSSYPSCCRTFFHSRPFFSPSAGTCFTTRAEIVETTPATYSNVRIWTAVDDKDTPDLDIVLMGTGAADKAGVFWTVTFEDHPAKALFTRPRKVSTGTATLVGLKKRQVDRTQLRRPCLNNVNRTFEDRYGLAKTRLNCLLALSHYTVQGCSKGVYLGLKKVDGLRPCEPRDHLPFVHSRRRVLDAEAVAPTRQEEDSKFGYDPEQCDYDCTHTYFDLDVSTSSFDLEVVERFFTSDMFVGRGSRVEARNLAVLQFYFETFDFQKVMVFEEGFLVFLSKVGGWMGLAQGASAISLLEIAGFFAIFGNIVIGAMSECLVEKWRDVTRSVVNGSSALH